MSPTSSAGGRLTARSVRNRIPDPVLTTLPLGIVFELVGSRLSNRTLPVALASSIRWPVAGNVSAGLDIDREQLGRHDRGRGRRIRRRGGGTGHDPQRLGADGPFAGRDDGGRRREVQERGRATDDEGERDHGQPDDERRPADGRAERPTDRRRPDRPGTVPFDGRGVRHDARRRDHGGRPTGPLRFSPGRRGRPRSSAGRRRCSRRCGGAGGRGTGRRGTGGGRAGGRRAGGRRTGGPRSGDCGRRRERRGGCGGTRGGPVLVPRGFWPGPSARAPSPSASRRSR